MSTPYIALSDLIGMIPAQFLAEALDDAGTGSANPEVWARIAQDTQNEIDGVLGKLYPVPFSVPLPAFIVSAAQLLAADRIYKRRGTEKNPYAADAASIRKEMAQIGEPTKVIFDQLGLSLDRLKGEDAVTQFKEIGTAISSLATQSDKIAAVRAIFGRQGANMINILSDPKAIEEAAKSTAEKAAIYEKNAALFTRVTNEFEAVGMKTKGFFLGAAESAAHALEVEQ